jgi:hypothetical protein
MFQAHTKCKKKKLNVGEVQTLPRLQFVISQRQTEKRDKGHKETEQRWEGNKTLTIWVAKAENYEVFGCGVVRESGGYLEKACYYYDL